MIIKRRLAWLLSVILILQTCFPAFGAGNSKEMRIKGWYEFASASDAVESDAELENPELEELDEFSDMVLLATISEALILDVTLSNATLSNAGKGVEGFVQNFYQKLFDREAEPQELQEDMDSLESHRLSGADFALGMMGRSEFADRGLEGEKYVDTLYQAFFQREPEAEELEDAMPEENSDLSRAFSNSLEFQILCQEYGIGSESLELPNEENSDYVPAPKQEQVLVTEEDWKQEEAKEPVGISRRAKLGTEFYSSEVDFNNITFSTSEKNMIIHYPESVSDYIMFKLYDPETYRQKKDLGVQSKDTSNLYSLESVDAGTYEIIMFGCDTRSGTYTSFFTAAKLTVTADGITFPDAVNKNNNQKFLDSLETDAATLFRYTQPSTRVESEDEQIVELATSITVGMTDDYEKVQALHDWVSDNIYYDNDVLNGRVEYGTQSALDTLETRKGVCQGYAGLYAALLRSQGIPARIVQGYGAGHENLFTASIISSNKANHAWSAVYVDSHWMTVDTTWDSANTYEFGTYTYGGFDSTFFDVSNEYFSFTHRSICDSSWADLGLMSSKEAAARLLTRNMYQSLLQRNPSSSEESVQAGKLLNLTISVSEVIEGILGSEEFTNLEYTDEEYVERIYKSCFRDAAGAAEVGEWLDRLAIGMSRISIAKLAVESPWIVNTCTVYGIRKGTVLLTENRDQSYGVTAYVSGCYQNILGRKADIAGLNSWTGNLNDMEKGAGEIIDRFLRSKEYTNRGMNIEQSVDIIYQSMLGRIPDASGKASYVRKLQDGVSYSYVVKAITASREFLSVCNSYGVIPGTLTLTENRDQNYLVTQYVSRSYQVIFGRMADIEGLNSWTGRLNSGTQGGAGIVNLFLKSSEFMSKKKTNEAVIELIYQAMMGRNADSEGKKSWKSILDSGVSTTYVVRGFAKSMEFSKICNKYGIRAGEIQLIENRDQNLKVTQFVNRCYEKALQRTGDESGVNQWCGQLITKQKTPAEIARRFAFSREAAGKNWDDEEFVKILYRLCMNREADAQGLGAWISRLKTGYTREKVFESFVNSREFMEIVVSYGL